MKKTIKLILIIICMITIFCFSSDDSSHSTKKSDRVIISISKILKKDKSNYKSLINKYVFLVRKGAHFTIYFILGLLLFSYFCEFKYSFKKTFLLSIFLAFLYASSDEVHQLFVSGRSGQISDVFLDTVGACFGILVYKLILNLVRRKHEQEKRFI